LRYISLYSVNSLSHTHTHAHTHTLSLSLSPAHVASHSKRSDQKAIPRLADDLLKAMSLIGFICLYVSSAQLESPLLVPQLFVRRQLQYLLRQGKIPSPPRPKSPKSTSSIRPPPSSDTDWLSFLLSLHLPFVRSFVDI